jgi:hypothetical protein
VLAGGGAVGATVSVTGGAVVGAVVELVVVELVVVEPSDVVVASDDVGAERSVDTSGLAS